MSAKMRAVFWEGMSGENPILNVKEVEMPVPNSGEVLIRMEASPINPSDLMFIRGLYPAGKTPPCIPGFEGSGTVVAYGGGLLGWRLMGKRVACVSTPQHGGTWAEYMVTDAKFCVKLNDNIDLDQGSCFFVNPLTVVMFGDFIKSGKHRAVVHTAAASQLGRMLLRWSLTNDVVLINIVRRQEQVEILRELGAEYILNSSDPNFEDELKKITHELNATIAFDAVAGESTGKLINNMPRNSTVYIYGGLSMEPIGGMYPGNFIFQNKKIEGAWLSSWLESRNIFGKLRAMNAVGNMLNSMFASTFSARYALDDIYQAVESYHKNMSAGKVLIKPWLNVLSEKAPTSEEQKQEELPSTSQKTDPKAEPTSKVDESKD